MKEKYPEILEKVGVFSWEKVQGGWSDDEKFCITTKDNNKYLLRISRPEKAERKEYFFQLALKVAALDIPMSRPVLFDKCEEGAYAVYTWIEGENAEDALVKLIPEKQYQYGIEAGRILKKIHTIPAPKDIEGWETRFNRKIDSKIKMYMECSLKYEKDEGILRYIEENRHLLMNRPQCYQHGDYHVGNMMLGVDNKLYIIDFDRDDFGDPWEEFNRIVWCAQAAPSFATGMVDGYFDNNVPDSFWRLLALYICSNTLSSLPWAIRFGQKQIEVMRKQEKQVLEWYDNMTNPIPTWYGYVHEK